jgi:hypothetical protein
MEDAPSVEVGVYAANEDVDHSGDVAPVEVDDVGESVQEVTLNSSLKARLDFWTRCQKKGPTWAFFSVTGDSESLADSDIPQVQSMDLACVLCSRGRIKWKKSNGSSTLRMHVKNKHGSELDEFLKHLDEGRSLKKRKQHPTAASKKATKLRTIKEALRMGNRTYSVEHVENQKFETNTVLYICKGLAPLSTVECPWFARLVLSLDPKLRIPSRSRLCRTLLPKIAHETRETYVTSTLINAPAISLTFDLWMSCGNMDIFSVLAHTLDE